jgi:hypothetical protein
MFFSGMKLVSHQEKKFKIKQLHGKRADNIISHFWPISYPETEIKALAGNLCFFYVCALQRLDSLVDCRGFWCNVYTSGIGHSPESNLLLPTICNKCIRRGNAILRRGRDARNIQF